uniref:peptidoglycan-binding domain-containing protein n=1 Tax=Ruminococcus flavefaciens TaxID=1265 RepID=UPI0026F2DC1B
MHHKKTRKTHRTAAALAAAVIMLGGGNGFTPFYPSNMISLNAAGASSSDTELGIPYARPTGNPLLRKGSKGEGVSWVQSALNKLGYNLTVDGDFGSGTEKAVKQFQTSSGLSVDGIVGKDTINKIVEQLKPVTTAKTTARTTPTTTRTTTTTARPTTTTPQKDTELGIPYARPTGNPLLKNGSSGEGVSWVQSALNKLGYKLTVDGIFGNGTEQAVRQFQKSCKISDDGIVGKDTINKIVEQLKP